MKKRWRSGPAVVGLGRVGLARVGFARVGFAEVGLLAAGLAAAALGAGPAGLAAQAPTARETAAAAARVIDTSYRTEDGMRVLRQEIAVPAPPEAIWPLFSTAEGFASWAVPHAWIDFRVGGTIETSYEAEAEEGHPHNIRNRILSYLPGRMLSIQAVQAPPGFPAPEILDELFTVIELEPTPGGGTRVVVSGLGYRDGEPYETLEEFFRRGNAWTLEQLHERVREDLPAPDPAAGPRPDPLSP